MAQEAQGREYFSDVFDAEHMVTVHKTMRWYLNLKPAQGVKCKLTKCDKNHPELESEFMSRSHETQEAAIFDVAKQLCRIQIGHYTTQDKHGDSTEARKLKTEYEEKKKKLNQLSSCMVFIAEEFGDGQLPKISDIENIQVLHVYTAELNELAFLKCEDSTDIEPCNFEGVHALQGLVMYSEESWERAQQKLATRIQVQVRSHKNWHDDARIQGRDTSVQRISGSGQRRRYDGPLSGGKRARRGDA